VESGHPVDWFYLYGIVRRSDLDLSQVAGVESGRAVSLVGDGELACAVSFVPRADYSPDAMSARGEQLDWLAPRAVRHQQVIDRLRQAGAVVPLRFGTLCAAAEDVRHILEARRELLLRLLASFEGRDEWGVKVRANADLVGQAIESDAADPGPPASGGAAYFLRKKRQKLAQERTTVRLAELDAEIYALLLPYAVDGRKRPCQDSDPPQVLVLNAALLVDRDRASALAEAVGRLEAEYSGYGLAAELSGPWAPYNFCGDLGPAHCVN
jgi:Gas vesicle synthesis protein GvpL/GvpF